MEVVLCLTVRQFSSTWAHSKTSCCGLLKEKTIFQYVHCIASSRGPLYQCSHEHKLLYELSKTADNEVQCCPTWSCDIGKDSSQLKLYLPIHTKRFRQCFSKTYGECIICMPEAAVPVLCECVDLLSFDKHSICFCNPWLKTARMWKPCLLF